MGEVRRAANAIALSNGYCAEAAGRVAIVATELASNLVKHTTAGGEILLSSVETGESSGIEIISLDKGPGIENPQYVLQDGVSTAGTVGNGLGAVRRLSQVFDLYTRPGQGTAIVARIFERGAPVTATPLQVGAVLLPKPGEAVSGDGWAVRFRADGGMVLVTDGLGHGEQAAAASQQALRLFLERAISSPAQFIRGINEPMRHTRGAAMALATIDLVERHVVYAGVGNIAGRILSPQGVIGCLTYNGTVGLHPGRFQENSYSWPEQALLVMHSDGLTSRWDHTAYPGLLMRHPTVIAAVLYRDFFRGNDDVTVVVVQQGCMT
ncbi:SpoIIE family protein phosphatase [Heliobacterium gestii]|uniref:SpoIIE family protein phosphatase n=1 Tax=Heliomicrobium gestii TaxID=2699 RepID=A0A845LCS3_HELGE|nr:ATP-binding SpoIIE family protein phosphatase [Heliomicrobium gestii]MBM7868353.1 anti-sigma regulatory factor (Ser/Thr protein kinase) [Heliomicrobium gestii]MZP42439.1 SpoIIE family protein phosphatase [Heliomicrobium gestii]